MQYHALLQASQCKQILTGLFNFVFWKQLTPEGLFLLFPTAFEKHSDTPANL